MNTSNLATEDIAALGIVSPFAILFKCDPLAGSIVYAILVALAIIVCTAQEIYAIKRYKIFITAAMFSCLLSGVLGLIFVVILICIFIYKAPNNTLLLRI